jgi:hypothetical protein
MEYAQSKWADFMPALTAVASDTSNGNGAAKGRQFPRQASQGSSGSNVTAGRSYIQQKYGEKATNKER